MQVCSFSIFSSAILSNLMSDSPFLIPLSFFKHTISAVMVVDDKSFMWHKIKIKLKTGWTQWIG